MARDLSGMKRKPKRRVARKRKKKNIVARKPKIPQTKYFSPDYIFLQYIRLVFKWAMTHHRDLKRADLEMLLYLYPVGTFSKTQFTLYHKNMGLYAVSKMKQFLADGWIKQFRERKNRQSALYTLTRKAKMLCNKMHKMSCGEADIPTKSLEEKIIGGGVPKSDNYYLDAIKKMNAERARRLRKEG